MGAWDAHHWDEGSELDALTRGMPPKREDTYTDTTRQMLNPRVNSGSQYSLDHGMM